MVDYSKKYIFNTNYNVYIKDSRYLYVDFENAVSESNLIVILSDHNEFKNMDYTIIKNNMDNPVIFDTKNIVEQVPSDIKLYNYGNLFELSN